MAVKKVTKVITPKETKIVKHEMETPIIIPDEIVAEEPIVEEVIETETLPELDTVELVEEEETAKPLDEVVEPETVETQPEVKQEDEVIEEVKPKSVLAQKLSEKAAFTYIRIQLDYFRFFRKSANSDKATFFSSSFNLTLTCSASASFGPTISTQGIFIAVASRIFLPRLSLRSSSL